MTSQDGIKAQPEADLEENDPPEVADASGWLRSWVTSADKYTVSTLTAERLSGTLFHQASKAEKMQERGTERWFPSLC